MLKTNEIKQSPMTTIVAPKVGKRLPSFVAEKDMQTLTAACRVCRYMESRTDKLLLDLFYATGMRLSELINLKESYIDGQITR
jgi:integrase/recombinase XerC